MTDMISSLYNLMIKTNGKKYLLHKAVTEMTCIRQEYGDVVCCIGSSLNARNFSIFAQSDIR